jgi:hypothetical protein
MAKRPNAPFQRPSLPARLAGTYRRWPGWAKVAVPAVVVLLVIGAVAGGDEGDGDEVVAEETSTTTGPPATFADVTLDDAVDQAAEVAPVGVSDADLADLIEATCDGLAEDGQEADEVAADVADQVGEAVAPVNVAGTVEAR